MTYVFSFFEPVVGIGMNAKFTLTFSKGGATEFARTFFRLTEGTVSCSKTE